MAQAESSNRLSQFHSICNELEDCSCNFQIDTDVHESLFIEISLANPNLPVINLVAFDLEDQFAIVGYVENDGFDVLGFLLWTPIKPKSLPQSILWKYDMDEDDDLWVAADLGKLKTRQAFKEIIIQALDELQTTLLYFLENSSNESDKLSKDDYFFNIEGCVDGFLSESPAGLLNSDIAEAYCTCLAIRIEADPNLLKLVLDPTTDEGAEFVLSCLKEAMPDIDLANPELRESFDHLIESEDFDPSQIFATKCKENVGLIQVLSETQFNESRVEAYCDCWYEEIMKIPNIELSDFDDPYSPAVLRIESICLDLLFEVDTASTSVVESVFTNCTGPQRIPIIWDGSSHKVRIEIGGVEKYYSIDSSLTFLGVNKSVALKLEASGTLNQDSFKGLDQGELPDGRIVDFKVYAVDSIQIGGCIIENCTIGVPETGGMFCGLSFLEMFNSWDIDASEKILILE